MNMTKLPACHCPTIGSVGWAVAPSVFPALTLLDCWTGRSRVRGYLLRKVWTLCPSHPIACSSLSKLRFQHVSRLAPEHRRFA
jgi:hypothetical protein